MLDKQLQGQNPLLGLLTGTGGTTKPVGKAQEPTEQQTLDFKQVLDDESQVEKTGELNPLEEFSLDGQSVTQVASQQADKNQAPTEFSASLFGEARIGESSVVTSPDPFLAQALSATVDLTSAQNELATTTLESASDLIPASEQASGVLDPTSSGTTVLNSESVQRLNLLREQNGAPQLSLGTQSSAAAPVSEPTFPVLFPAQDTAAENLGVIPTEETPTAKSVLEAQANVAAEQTLDSPLVSSTVGFEQVAASAAEELPKQVVKVPGTASDRLVSQAATEELAPSSENAAELVSVSVKPSREIRGQGVVSPNALPTAKSSGQIQANEVGAAEQLVSEFPEESLESDAEPEGNQLDGQSSPQGIPELDTSESVEPTSSVERFEQQFQAQNESAVDYLRGSADVREVAPQPSTNPAALSFAQTQSTSAADKLASPQATLFQASVAEAQGHGVVDQISQPLREHVSLQRDGTLQVNLEPAELGPVSITVQRTADGLSAQLVAAESLTTELLITQQQDLKDTLVNFGFDEVHVDVSQRDDNDRTGERTDSHRQHSDNNQFEEQQDVVENLNASNGTINVVA